LLVAGCQPKGPELGEVERLNGDPGMVGRYMVAYYVALHAGPEGGAVVTWMREEPPYRTVVYRQAPKAGAPFGAETRLTPPDMLETITIGLTLLPGTTDGELYAAWQARRPHTGKKFIVFRGSRDHGATWSEPRTLNSEATAFAPAITTDRSGGVYVAWPDEREYNTGVFFNRSLDRGESWMERDIRVDAGEGGGLMANAVSAASDGERVVLVWEEQQAGGRAVMSAVSTDRGATWSTPMRVDDGKGRGAPLAPRVVFAGKRPVISWTAAVGGNNRFAQIWADSSADGGATWGEDVLIHEQPGGMAPTMQVFSDGTQAAVVFEARSRGGETNRIFHVAMSADGTWNPNRDALAPLTPPEMQATAPRLARGSDGTLYLAFVEGPRRVRLMRSKDGGTSWSEPLLVFERPESEPGATVRFPQVAVGDGMTYVLWEEWGEAKATIKTFGDSQTKRPPLDIFIRRITFPD
jgi:hypothetical protein